MYTHATALLVNAPVNGGCVLNFDFSSKLLYYIQYSNMINLQTIDDAKLPQTMRLIKAELLQRGWQAHVPYIGSSLCTITRDDGRSVRIFSATPPTTSFAAAYLVNDKFASYQVLQVAGVPQLESMLVQKQDSFDDQVAFMDRLGEVVAKPVDGAHGRGVTTCIATADALREAVEYALAHSKNGSSVLLQKQYPHEHVYDIRVLCIDYQFVAAILRVPARVYGDGVQTIRQLIQQENNRDERGEPYIAKLAEIDVQKAEAYLGVRIDMIPQAGEEVSVLGIANYGAGGETIDITDDIPEWMRHMAEAAARASILPVAGIDFMVAQLPSVAADQKALDPVVVEVNKCPSLCIHDTPTTGASRGVTKRYIDYLASLQLS